MSNPVFKVRVDDKRVVGEYGQPGLQPEVTVRVDLVLDRLILDTADLMNRWLCFWDLIQGSGIRRKETLLDSGTLVVLGKQLWRLILDNEVGNLLKEKIPGEGKPPIRLSIEFEDRAAPTLRGLPWEFLLEPDKGWFLATKTELSLTRYVSVEVESDTVGQVGDREKVRALLIAALPDEPRFASDRETLYRLRTALDDVENLEVAKPISVWDPEKIKGALRAKDHHIVHVVGICRGVPGKPEIYLGGEGDGFQDPRVFVECLTANKTRPRLVILQLCDYVDGDATENFERLAPELIKSGVPAVLALQYAAKPRQADEIGLGKSFYQSLVQGEHIGAAVQASRSRLLNNALDRRFGTPVLYLQEDGALRRPESGIGLVTSSARSGTSGGHTARDRLIDLVEETGKFEDDELGPFLDWLAEVDPQLGPTEMRILVRKKMFDPPDQDDAPRTVYREAYLALGKLERGHAASRAS
jgi:hypothetical protein